jgi:putative flavoprotein involved in K+ transport
LNSAHRDTWRTERWDSLRLLTPNWQSRLPDFGYSGNDPDGYRTLTEVIEFIASYAKAISAPVRTHTTVTSVRSTEAGYLVRTDEGDWLCRTIVLASGACNIADVPTFANRVPPSLLQLTGPEVTAVPVDKIA